MEFKKILQTINELECYKNNGSITQEGLELLHELKIMHDFHIEAKEILSKTEVSRDCKKQGCADPDNSGHCIYCCKVLDDE